MDLIRSFVRIIIGEDAAARKQGRRDMSMPNITKYIDDSAVPRYFFTMTSLDKVGLNPKSPYNTPAGVYAYPLTNELYIQLRDGKLPFANEQKYCTVLERLDKNPLVCEPRKFNQTSEMLRIKEKYFELLESLTGINQDKLTDFDGKNRFFSYGIPSWLFGITYQITKKPAAWSKLLITLGFNSVIDMGHGIIHPNEPTQAVFLTPNSYRIVGRFETRQFRKVPLSHVMADLIAGNEPQYVHNDTESVRIGTKIMNWIMKNPNPTVIMTALNQKSIEIPIGFKNSWVPPENIVRQLATMKRQDGIHNSLEFNYAVAKWLLDYNMELTCEKFLLSLDPHERSKLYNSFIGKRLPRPEIDKHSPMSFSDDDDELPF